MATGKSVLIIGLQPKLVDFSLPEFATMRDLDAQKIQAALDADEAKLKDLGYDPEMCLTDLGAMYPGPQPGKESTATHHGSQATEGMRVKATLCSADASTTEEPEAGKLHVRDCTAGAGSPAFLP